MSRILFLCTVSLAASSYIRSLVETKPHGHSEPIVDVVAAKLDMLLYNIQSGDAFAKEAMIDLLKMVFNLLAHYPKVRSFLTSRVIAASKMDSVPDLR